MSEFFVQNTELDEILSDSGLEIDLDTKFSDGILSLGLTNMSMSELPLHLKLLEANDNLLQELLLKRWSTSY